MAWYLMYNVRSENRFGDWRLLEQNTLSEPLVLSCSDGEFSSVKKEALEKCISLLEATRTTCTGTKMSIVYPRLVYIEELGEEESRSDPVLSGILNQSDEELDAKLSVCLEDLKKGNNPFVSLEAPLGVHEPDQTAEA